MEELLVAGLSKYSWTFVVLYILLWVLLRLGHYFLNSRRVKKEPAVRKVRTISECLDIRLRQFKKSVTGSNYKKTSDKLDIYLFCGFVVSIVLVPVGLFMNGTFSWSINPDPMEWGVIGDFFGGTLNPILAFASFIALLYTIKLQSKEMEESRAEAKLSRVAQEASADTAKDNLKLQERLEVFKGLDSMLRARSAEAKSLYIQADEDGRTLQSVLTKELNKLCNETRDKLRRKNNVRGDGVPAIDWKNAKVNALQLKHRICIHTVPRDSGLSRVAASYRSAVLYELQAYNQLKMTTQGLELTAGLIDMYAQELVNNLLFSGLCYGHSILDDSVSLKGSCLLLSEHMKTLYDNLDLEMPQTSEPVNQNTA